MYRMPVLSKQPRREEVWQSVPAVGARTENNTHPYVPIEIFATGRDPCDIRCEPEGNQNYVVCSADHEQSDKQLQH